MTKNPVIIYGEQINQNFFKNLLVDQDSKYITDFKRYFNYLKKNHDNYKKCSIKDRVSIDAPLYDYVNILNDWLQLETDNLYTIFLDHTDELFFGFKINNPVDGDTICKIVKDWNKYPQMKEDYNKWISIFDKSKDELLFYSLI